jgi:uncharacterized cofD-like protein
MKKIVTITGGSGGHVILTGLAQRPLDITAVCTTFDSGGHSGKIRGEFGFIPPGDLRQCLCALSSGEMSDLWKTIFMYRFKGDANTHLDNVSLGNAIMTSFFEQYGQEVGMEKLNTLLCVKGKVWPVSFDNAELCVHLSSGEQICGEANIDKRSTTDERVIESLSLIGSPQVTKIAYDAIVSADAIIIRPGDLYTSVLPNLLVGGMHEALMASNAKLIFVCNLMNKYSETGESNSAQITQVVNRYLPSSRQLDVVIVNNERIPDSTLGKYIQEERAKPVRNIGTGTTAKVRGFDLLSIPALNDQIVRHDSSKLARAIMEILQNG